MILKFLFFVFFSLAIAQSAEAVTRYVHPNGSGTSGCTNPGAPCAISAIGVAGTAAAGDTWILQGTTSDTYSSPSTISIDCAAGHNSGTAGNRITIKSENERQPLITGNGGRFLEIKNCNYYTVEGLRFDGNGAHSTYPFFALNNNFFEFKRNLLYDINDVYFLWMEGVSDSLVEENECYGFTLGCTVINSFFGDDRGSYRNIKRRNYCNPYPKSHSAAGNCFDIYQNMGDNIIENNIGELNYSVGGGTLALGGTGGHGTKTKTNTKILGNIGYGFGTLHKKSPTGTATDTRVENNLFIIDDGGIAGIYIRNQTSAVVINNTVMRFPSRGNNYSGMVRDDCEGFQGTEAGNEGANWTNNLFHDVSGIAIYTDGFFCPTNGLPSSTGSHNGFSNVTTQLFAGDGGAQNITNPNTTTMSATHQQCPAFVPAGAPHKGAGQGGADIGAAILYAYEGGVLNTSKRLWVPSTGELDTTTWGGAVIATINGPSGTYSVNLRNIGSRIHPDCPQSEFDLAYGSTAPVVVITTPTSDPTYSTATATINIAGTCSDADGLASVTWLNNRGGSGTATGTTSWSQNSISLVIGTNVLTVTCTDNLGAASNDILTVTYDPGAPAQALIIAMNFDAGTGSTVTDHSGNNNHGTISGASWIGGGRFGGALSFDGSNDVLTIADSATLDQLTHGLTIQIDVFATSIPSAFKAVAAKNATGGAAYIIALYATVEGYCGNAGTLGWTLIDGATGFVNCHATPLQVNTLTNLALTWNGSSMKLYKNAVEVASVAMTGLITPTAGDFTVGASQYGEHFAGWVDQLRVYNYALDQATIESNMTSPIQPPAPPRTVRIGSGVRMGSGVRIGNQ